MEKQVNIQNENGYLIGNGYLGKKIEKIILAYKKTPKSNVSEYGDLISRRAAKKLIKNYWFFLQTLFNGKDNSPLPEEQEGRYEPLPPVHPRQPREAPQKAAEEGIRQDRGQVS